MNPDPNTTLGAFGPAIVIAGSNFYVGAPYDAIGGVDKGAVFEYTLSDGSWVESSTISETYPGSGDMFGSSIAVSGSTMLIGGPGYDGQIGEVDVYTLESGVWTATGGLGANNSASGDSFGASVAISGSTAIVGAPYKQSGYRNHGAAYVFTYSGYNWEQVTELSDPIAESSGYFGYQ